MDRERDLQEAMGHLGEFVTPELVEFAKKTSRGFLWRSRLNAWRERTYTCSLCGCRFDASDQEQPDIYSAYPGQAELRHDNRIFCPDCEREVTVYDEWRSIRAAGMRRHFVEQWRVSRTDPDVIVAVGAEVRYRYRVTGEVMEEPVLYPKGFVVFKWGRAAARYLPDSSGTGFHRASRVNWLDATCETGLRDELDDESVERAIKASVWRRVWFDGLIVVRKHDGGRNSPLMRLGTIGRTPCMEYMIKGGFGGLVMEKFRGVYNDGPVNWSGKTMEEVFGLDRATVRALRPYGAEMTYGELEAFKWLNRIGLGWPAGKIMEAVRGARLYKHSLEWLETRDRRYGYRDAEEMRYYLKQWKRENTCRLSDMFDYWDQCDKLEVPQDDYRTRHPRSLPQAHAEFTERIKYKDNRQFDGQIQERLPGLEKAFGFTGSELFLRPCADTGEMIREGSRLHHCVGGYCARYAKGDTVILVLRRISDPETPFHTVEMTPDGRLIQCRGDKNQTKEEDRPVVDRFWREYNARRMKRAC